MKPCILVDIDGTLADVRGIGYLIKDEGRKDYDEFHRQSQYVSEHEDIANAVRAWSAYVPIIIVTARGERYRSQTEHWLAVHGIKHDALYMRPDGDHSPDEQLKAKIYKSIVDKGHKPMLAYEDNDMIIRLWHEYGIPTVRGVGW